MNDLKLDNLEDILQEIEKRGLTAYKISQETTLTEAGLGKIINRITKKPNKTTLDILKSYLTNYDTNNSLLIKKDKIDKEVSISNDETIDVLRNNNGNTYYIKDDGSVEIEVVNLPFPAYASYLEVFTDERQVVEEFNKTKFAVDKIGKGYYMSFDIKGDSMNGGGIDDTPDGAKVLARELGRHLWQSFRKEKYGYILMTKNNIYHKDIVDFDNEEGILTLHSRNPNCNDFTISINDVYRIFYVIKRTF